MNRKLEAAIVVIIMASAIVFSLAANAQWYNPDLPIIEEFSINPKTINKEVGDTGDHPMLWEENGYVYIPTSYYKQKRSGSLGILVVHTFDGRYEAFEHRCAKCFYVDGIKTSV